ncbi:MAG: radical SAM/SPASM domain-containing protein [Verrucomicrobiota bacterium]
MRSRPVFLLPFDRVGAEQSEWDGATDEITFDRPVGQVFTCAHDALHRIEIYLEPTFHYKRSHLWLHLYEGDLADGGPPVPVRIAGPLATESLLANGWLSFEFHPVAGSAQKTYTFALVAPDAGPGNALSVRSARGPATSARGLLVGGQPRPGALAFRALCLRAPELWPNFVRFRQRSRERTPGVDYRPLLARLEISRPCNLHCVMCLRGLNPFDAKREGTAFMSPATFQALDPLLPDLLWLIAFGLGEPFLNPHYLEMLRHARSRNAHLHIFTSTNGMVLKDEAIAAIVSENLLSTLQVSLDGAEAATFEAIRVKASYATVRHSLERVLAERARQRNEELRVRAAMLVMRPNVDQVFTFIRQMADLGVDLISLDSPKGESFLPLRADTPDDLARIYEQVARGQELLAGTSSVLDGPLLSELHQWHQRTGQTSALPDWGRDACAQLHKPDARRSVCPVPWESFNLAADGEVRVCCNSNRHMGHLPAEKMATVWASAAPFGQLRSELVAGNLHHDCRTCLGENVVTPGELTPQIYLSGCVANPGATAHLASLLGASVPLATLPLETGLSLAVDPLSPAASEAASHRLRGTLFGELPPGLLLALCVDGVVEGFSAPLAVSAGVAQWSAWLDRPLSPCRAARLTLLALTRDATGAQLSRLPLAPPALTRTSPPPRPAAPATLTGFVDEVRLHGGILQLRGWARDGAARTPAHQVTALLEGEAPCSVYPWLDRPDVARHHGDAPARFGFALEIPLPASPPTRPRRLQILAHNPQHEATALFWGTPPEFVGSTGESTLRLYRENDEVWLVQGPL